MLLWQLALNGLIAAGLYALAAVGFGLVYRTTRFFNLAHGAMFTVGAYAAFAAATSLGLAPLLAVFAGGLAAAGTGAAAHRLVFLPVRRRGGDSTALLLASSGLLVILQNVVSVLFGDETRAFGPASLRTPVSLLGAGTTVLQLLSAGCGLAVSIATAVWLLRTRHGNSILAVGADEQLAGTMGINADRLTTAVFAVGSALAGSAGALAGLSLDITPTMGYAMMLNAVVATLIGGIYSPLGWLLGAALLSFGQHLAIWQLGGEWRDAVAVMLLTAILVARPAGLIATKPLRS